MSRELLREKDRLSVGPHLWIVDEAGLLSTRDMAKLLRKAEAAGAKVVLVGDRLQHRAIEAGQPFAQRIEGDVRTARMTEIRRQRDAKLREAVREASSAAAGRAVLSLQHQGRLEQYAARADRLQLRAPGSALVVAATNADRRELNHRIRKARIAARQVERQSTAAHVLVSKDMTRAEHGRAAALTSMMW